MIDALIELKRWLQTWHIPLEGLEIRLVFPKEATARLAKSQLLTGMPYPILGGGISYPGYLMLMGFRIRFLYKYEVRTQEGEA